MSEHFGENERQEALKEIVRDLHEGSDIAKVRKRFAALIRDVSPEEIARMEQALITEGVPVEHVQKMCDVHVAVFEESLKRGTAPKALTGHPVKTFQEENQQARKMLRRLRRSIGGGDFGDRLTEMREIEKHYVRKENLLFPLLERAGFTGPSKVMWGKQDEIRGHLKAVDSAYRAGDTGTLAKRVRTLSRAVKRMIFMEERILFPTALRLLSEAQWAVIRKGEAEIGYAWVEPGNLWDANLVLAKEAADNLGKRENAASGTAPEPAAEHAAASFAGAIPLDTGALSPEQLNLLLTNLPLDITYVDENDKVLYYSQGKERIFPRTPAIIGREVRNCHPPKSVHVVERILSDFKRKERDAAEFWLTMGGRFIHIRYFPIYGADGAYRGVLEVSQDVTGIRGLQGEKRLLD